MENCTSLGVIHTRTPHRVFGTILILILTAYLGFADGIHQANPGETDIVLLHIDNNDFQNFAGYDGPVESRLNATMKAGDCLYIGISPESNSLGSLQNTPFSFRVVDEAGNVVHGPFLVDQSNANAPTFAQAIGPAELGFAGGYTTTDVNGAEVFKYCAPAAGDYRIEFDDVRYLKYWDFTVGNGATPVPGRIWSTFWAFRTPGPFMPFPECFWTGEFNGTLYSYTADGFVSNIDFNGAGMRGLAFGVAFNTFGPQQIFDANGDLDLVESRKSITGTDEIFPEHKIFLSPPDPTCFLSGTCGLVTTGPNFSCSDTCIEVGVNEPGQVEIIIDFNQNGLYDEDLDVAIIHTFEPGEPLTECIPWNGLRADGSPPGVNNFNILTTYTQGVQHWAVRDLEILENGFCVQNIRPDCPGSDASNILYWDDSNIPLASGTGQPNTNLEGCICGAAGCRTWTNFSPDPNCINDLITTGYGDKNTLNTWWFANIVTDMIVDLNLFCAEGELGLAKEVSNYEAAASGVDGNFDVTYSFVLGNTGDADVSNISVIEDLVTQLGGAFVQTTAPVVSNVIATAGSTAPMTNPTYDGGVTSDSVFLFSSGGIVIVGGQITFDITVEIDPDNPTAILVNGALENQASTSGVDPLGETPTDDSDSGTDPDGDNPDAPGDMSTPDDPTPLLLPAIGIAKEVGNIVPAAILGNYLVTYSFVVENYGMSDLSNITIIEDLVTQLGGAFVATTAPIINNVVATPGSTAPTINGTYDGGVFSDSVFLASSGGILLVDGQLTFDITVEIDPDNPTAIITPSGTLDNQATVSGTDPNGVVTMDDSDSGTDPNGSNPDAPGDMMTSDDPTPLSLPGIAITKAVQTAVVTQGVDGNFTVTYFFVVQNIGNTDLQAITVEDNLVMQLGGAFVSTTMPLVSNIVASAGSIAPMANSNYDGGVSDAFIFDATSGGLLVSGGTITFSLTVEIDPDNPTAITSPNGTLDNQATATGQDPTTGDPVMDDSDSGTDPTSNNPGAPGDMNTSDDPTPLALPAIGIAKTVGSYAPSATAGNFDVTYSFVVANLGMTELSDIAVEEDFVTQLGGAFVSTTVPVISNIVGSAGATVPTSNGSYDGGLADAFAFETTSGAILPIGESFSFDITVEINPADPAANYSANGTLDNQATVSAVDENGVDVTDLSDSGTDPAGTNPDEPGDMMTSDDPTPLALPSMAIVKAVGMVAPAASNAVGNFDITYSFIIQNTGTVALNNITVVDNFVAQLGGAFVSTTAPIINNIIASAGSSAPSANPSYDGGVADDSIFIASGGGSIIPGGTISFDVIVEIDPDNPTAIYGPSGSLDNQATTSGTDPSGSTITDDSDSGTDPIGDNPDEPGDMGTPDDPTPLNLPAIGIAKQVANAAPAASGIQGNFDVVYEFLIENLGNTPLDNIIVDEDFAMQLGGAFISTTTPVILNIVASTGSTAPTANPTYDGDGDAAVFELNTGALILNGTISFQIQVEIDPNAPGAIYGPNGTLDNQATVTGTDPEGNTPMDDSDSGTDPDGTNPDDPGDMGTPDDPTPLLLPSIEAAKTVALVGPSSNGVIGHFDAIYSFVIMNTGNVDLNNITMIDDLASQLGSGFVTTVLPIINNIAATGTGIAPTANSAYDGGVSNDSIFNQSSGGFLAPNDMITFDVLVTIAPNAPGAPSPLLNSATAGGTDPDGDMVDDDTDSGTDPEGTNPDDPNDMGTPDDSTLLEIPATIFCPDDITLDCPADIDTSITGVPQAYGNCSLGNTITLRFTDDDSGLIECGGTGTIVRTWIAEDPCGNMDFCEQIITVQDTTPPIVTFCPPDTIVNCDAGDISPDIIGWAVGMDECSTVQYGFVDDSIGFNGTCVNGIIGTITRTFNIADECENVSFCEQIIQVQDTVAPTLTFNDPFLDGYQSGDIIPYQCYGRSDTTFQLPMMDTSSVIAMDNCSDGISIDFLDEVVAVGDCETDGYFKRYKCTWTATDNCGNAAEVFFFLDIIDTIAPELRNVPEDVTVSCNAIPDTSGVIAWDECLCAHLDFEEEIISADPNCFSGATIIRTWTATDHCGNSTTASQTITIEDGDGPGIVIVNPLLRERMQNNAVEYDCNEGGIPSWFFELDDNDISINDVCSEASSISIDYSQLNVICYDGYLEHHVVTWTAIDACGNESTLSIDGLVYDNTPPVVQDLQDHQCVSSANDLGVDYYDECGNASASFVDEDFDIGCGNQTKLRRWYITDLCGNFVEVEQIILDDVTPPEITLIIDEEQIPTGTQMSFECGTELPIMVANSVQVNDDCIAALDITFESTNLASGNCNELGFISSTLYMWTATDPCGNTSSLELNILLTDETAPEFELLEEITVECGEELELPAVTDNCGEPTLSFIDEIVQGRDCDTLEIITRTYEATDECGNESKKTQIIYVVNEQGPSFDHNDEVLCQEFDRPVTAFDHCINQLVPVQLMATNEDRECGLIYNTYQATDNCGNVSEFVQTIIRQDTIAPTLLIVNPILQEVMSNGNDVFVDMSNVSLILAINEFSRNDVIAEDQCRLSAFVNFSRNIARNEECVDGEVEIWTFEWEGLDLCGNLTPMNLTVHVIDDIPPVILNVPADTSVICSAPPFAAVGTTDNYSDVTLGYTETTIPGNLPTNYTLVRTWTATDECGNSTMESQNVMVTNNVGLSCDINVADTIFCNSHFNIATVVPTGGTGPYTYDWDVLAGECLIESGQNTESIEFYMGFNEAVLSVTVTDANGCSTNCSYSIICVDGKEGIQGSATTDNGIDIQITESIAYPNPAVANVTVQFESNTVTFGRLSVTNAIGQSVYNEKIAVLSGINKYLLNTDRYSNGIYFVNVNLSDDVEKTIRFIKTK